MDYLLMRLHEDEELLRRRTPDGVGPKPGPLRAQRWGALELARRRGLGMARLAAELRDQLFRGQANDAPGRAHGETPA